MTRYACADSWGPGLVRRQTRPTPDRPQRRSGRAKTAAAQQEAPRSYEQRVRMRKLRRLPSGSLCKKRFTNVNSFIMRESFRKSPFFSNLVRAFFKCALVDALSTMPKLAVRKDLIIAREQNLPGLVAQACVTMSTYDILGTDFCTLGAIVKAVMRSLGGISRLGDLHTPTPQITFLAIQRSCLWIAVHIAMH